MKKAVLCGYYGKGNGGDEALLASLLQMLPPSIEPIVLSGNPEETRQQYGVEARDRMKISPIFKLLEASDIFIWGGGSLIQDSTSLTNSFYYGGLMGLAQKMGLKTIAWAQGIGPLNSPITRAIARKCFNNCTAVSVRDGGSASLLTKWKIPFTLAPDPVWALDSLPVVGLENLPTSRVAVNLRSHSSLTPKKLAILTQALIQFQKETNTFILLVPFQASQDLAIAQEIHQKIPQNSQVFSLTNPRELKGIFQGVKMTIGMRLHCIIMAASAGCNCFPLSYDPKVTNLMDELEMTGYLLSDLPNDPVRISKVWIEHYTQGERLSQDRIKYLVDRALIHQEVLREKLT